MPQQLDFIRKSLFRKYAGFFLAVVSLALVPTGALDLWFSYHEQRPLLVRIQSEQAQSAAHRIGQFIKEIENQMAWATQLPLAMKNNSDWRLDAVRLLRQVPALTQIAHLDAKGRERYRMSRQAMDVVESLQDFSSDPVFTETMASKVYYGPVSFVNGSEPSMTLAVAGAKSDFGVVVGQVNLKFIWDVVSQIKVGERGKAYVVDGQGKLIAHPDISLVLRNLDLSNLAQVRAARAAVFSRGIDQSEIATDLNGREVLSTSVPVAPLGWFVFAERPLDDAFAPLYDSLVRSALLLAAGLILAVCAGFLLTRRMVVPIRTLSEGAARIGGGDLSQRIAIDTGDELEALGLQFNAMAARLQESYATLEAKVEERTRQLEVANLAKSRFLAAASHDLRQPLHALGLFVEQLRGKVRPDERKRVVARIGAAIAAMNELFNALLDVSKLDAGALTPKITEFPVAQLFKRIETTFAATAREKNLSLRIVGSTAWLRSDTILLERILSNLVSNAVRYTATGQILVGCRRRRGELRIEVWDTGPGIPPDQQKNIFVEFCRLNKDQGGLGLGLAIVERLCRLLGHSLELTSIVGKGSCFAVIVPVGVARADPAKSTVWAPRKRDAANGKLIVVIDDDPMVLEGMNGLLKSWGYRVVTGSTDREVLLGLRQHSRPPDAVISDYHLRDGLSGVDAISRIRKELSINAPAFLMTADNNDDTQRIARANGYPLLHKPVDPMALRATLAHSVRKRETGEVVS